MRFAATTKRPLTQTERLHDALVIAREHLAQYVAYSESMRAIGRGCSISHPVQPDTLTAILNSAIGEVEAK